MSKFTEHIQKLKQDLAPMTGQQRLEHLWEYYKWVLVLLLVFIMLCVMVVDAVIQKNTELVLGGVAVNVQLSPEGQAYLQDGILEKFGTPGKRQEVTLNTLNAPDPTQAHNYETITASSTWMAGNVAAKTLDYALLDEMGLEVFMAQGVFTDITVQLSAQQREDFKDYIIYAPKTENQPSFPVAIDISHLPFVKDCISTADKVYLAGPGNTERLARIAEFVDYLLAWKK